MGGYIWDIGSDFFKYKGNDFAKAATVDACGTAAGVICGVLIAGFVTAAAPPLGVIIILGVGFGLTIGASEEIAKNAWIG